MVEVELGYLGYVGYRRDAVLFRDGSRWRIWIDGKRIYPVRSLRDFRSCREPSSYRVETASRDEFFIVNGEVFRAKTFCLGWSEGERVVFLGGSALGVCVSEKLLNLDRMETCELWCE